MEVVVMNPKIISPILTLVQISCVIVVSSPPLSGPRLPCLVKWVGHPLWCPESPCLPHCMTIPSTVEFYVSLPKDVSVCAPLIPFCPWAAWRGRGETCMFGFHIADSSLLVAVLPWKEMIQKTLEKARSCHPVSTNNDSVWNYSSLELLNRRDQLGSYHDLISKPAGERWPTSHRNQGWHVGTPGAPVLLERQLLLTQFEHSIAWRSTAIRSFNNLVTYEAVLMQSGADRAAEGRLCSSLSCVGNPLKVTATFATQMTVGAGSCKQERLVCFAGWKTWEWQTVSGTSLGELADTACLFCFYVSPYYTWYSFSLLPLPYSRPPSPGLLYCCVTFLGRIPATLLVHSQ